MSVMVAANGTLPRGAVQVSCKVANDPRAVDVPLAERVDANPACPRAQGAPASSRALARLLARLGHPTDAGPFLLVMPQHGDAPAR